MTQWRSPVSIADAEHHCIVRSSNSKLLNASERGEAEFESEREGEVAAQIETVNCPVASEFPSEVLGPGRKTIRSGV